VPPDPDARAYLDRVADAPAPGEVAPEVARANMAATASELFGPADPVGAVVDRAIPGPVRLRLYEPREGRRPYGVLVYFHGGGWVVGNLDTHDGVCRALCARTPCLVVAVDYRLAPEHRFPAALDDAWAATAWVAEHAASIGANAGRIAVGGDSAGGTLAAGVAARARDHGLSLVLQLLVYPVTDCGFEHESYRENGTGYGLTEAAMRWFWSQYMGPDGDPSDPEASPLRLRNLAGLAPAAVLTAEYDPLRDEGDAYAARLRDAGVPVTHVCLDGLIHGVLRMPGVIPRGREALDVSAAVLREAFAVSG
jgi:acetyl esterase/lipase